MVSNQAGIGRAAMTGADLDAIHERMRAEAEVAGGRIDAIYHCPHDWDDGCECRKPKPRMLFRAQRDLGLDLSPTYYIGDDERDAQAADAADSPCMIVSESFTLLDCARLLVDGHRLGRREEKGAANRGSLNVAGRERSKA